MIIKPKRKHLVDTELEGVQEQLLSEGIPGMAVRNVEITYTDGVETGRKILRDTFKVIKEPVPAKYIVSAEKDRMTPPNQNILKRICHAQQLQRVRKRLQLNKTQINL